MNPAASIARFIEFGKRRGGVRFDGKAFHVHTRHPDMRWRFLLLPTESDMVTLAHFSHDRLTDWLTQVQFQHYQLNHRSLHIEAGNLVLRLHPLSDASLRHIETIALQKKPLTIQQFMISPCPGMCPGMDDLIPMGAGRIVRPS